MQIANWVFSLDLCELYWGTHFRSSIMWHSILRLFELLKHETDESLTTQFVENVLVTPLWTCRTREVSISQAFHVEEEQQGKNAYCVDLSFGWEALYESNICVYVLKLLVTCNLFSWVAKFVPDADSSQVYGSSLKQMISLLQCTVFTCMTCTSAKLPHSRPNGSKPIMG